MIYEGSGSNQNFSGFEVFEESLLARSSADCSLRRRLSRYVIMGIPWDSKKASTGARILVNTLDWTGPMVVPQIVVLRPRAERR